MSHSFLSPRRVVVQLVVFLGLFVISSVSKAGVSGIFNYNENGIGGAEITGLTKVVKGKVNIPAKLNGLPVARIGNFAFQSQYLMTSVTIPSGVSEIGYAAFTDCSRLQSVTIPETAQLAAGGVFQSCFSLASITVAAGNPFHKSVDGVLYDAGLTVLLQYPSARSGSAFVVPATVTEIGPWAFQNAYLLKRVELPAGLQTIGENAFIYCNALEDLGVIPETVTSIGSGVFYGCPRITSFDVAPNNPSYASLIGGLLTKDLKDFIRFPAGSNTTAYSVPSGVERILSGAFADCDNLVELYLPASVSEIAEEAFNTCRNLQKIAVEDGNMDFSNLTSGFGTDGVLFNKAKTKLLRYPPAKFGTSYVVPAGVTEILGSAFDYAGKLESLTLATETTQAQMSVQDCFELVEIIAPVGNVAYASVNGVLYYKTSDGIVTIPPGLSGRLVIRDGETTLNGDGFYGTKVTILRLPASVTTINSNAYLGYSPVRVLEFEGNAPALGDGAFGSEAKGLSVRYLDGSTGFTSPKWQGLPAVKFTSLPLPEINVWPGNYAGLTQTDKPMVSDAPAMAAFIKKSAMISLTTKADRSFTGSLLLEGKKLPFKGVFDATSGNSTVTVKRGSAGNATVELSYVGSGRSRVSGNLTTTAGTASFQLNPESSLESGFHPLAGARYTALMDTYAPTGGTNPGQGYATISVSNDGTATVAGRLADGSKPFLQKIRILNNGSDSWYLPVYIPLYAGSSGLVSGDIRIPKHYTPKAGNLFGALTWMRPADSKSASLPAGFLRGLDVYGEIFAPLSGVSLLSGTAQSTAFEIGLDSTAQWTVNPGSQQPEPASKKSGTWPNTNIPVLASGAPSGFTLKLDLKTGIVTGTFPLLVGSKTVSTAFQGVLFDDSARSYSGGGFFVSQSGTRGFQLK